MSSITAKEREYRQTTRDIVGIFFVKQHVFILTLLGIIVGALALSLLTPPIYETSAQLVVKPFNSKPLVFDQDSSRMNVFNEVNEQTLNTVIFLLTSPEVLREVVLHHKLAPADDNEKILNEMESLKGRIKAEPLTMSSIVKVSLKGRNPQVITEQLNTLIDAYIRHHIRVNQATEGRLKFFNDQTEYFREQYEKLNHQLAETGRRLDIIDPNLQKDSSLMLIRDLEVSKSQLNTQADTLRAKIESFRAAASRFKSEDRLAGLPSETMLAYPALVEMEKSLAQLLINRQRALGDFLPSAKQAQDADNQYRSMKDQIRHHMEQIIHDLQTQLESIQKSMDDIEKKVIAIRKRGVEMTGDMLEMDRLALEHKLIKENYTLYSAKKEEARINEEKDKAQFANVSVANRPTLPISPWFPQRGKIMALSIPLALMLALAFSAMSYAMEQRLWTPTDIRLHTNLQVLGSLDAIGIPSESLLGTRKRQGPQAPINQPQSAT